ncbi:unnamed protein product [Vitrella brassicaformis CCMP3155]|uniref:Uncharacterized protein n=1 Tax=Vitrella brassicaformis (strain CCMP3155) TaxID=1169540 RepID=A0A0G4EXH5_VITBC|nr:unnamed protein product [Vitrella brassicaformis CCMP3155]|eukprot:CEM03508.1 unnamed protein product [Vitrella brassicaformis CCMP3155]
MAANGGDADVEWDKVPYQDARRAEKVAIPMDDEDLVANAAKLERRKSARELSIEADLQQAVNDAFENDWEPAGVQESLEGSTVRRRFRQVFERNDGLGNAYYSFVNDGRGAFFTAGLTRESHESPRGLAGDWEEMDYCYLSLEGLRTDRLWHATLASVFGFDAKDKILPGHLNRVEDMMLSYDPSSQYVLAVWNDGVLSGRIEDCYGSTPKEIYDQQQLSRPAQSATADADDPDRPLPRIPAKMKAEIIKYIREQGVQVVDDDPQDDDNRQGRAEPMRAAKGRGGGAGKGESPPSVDLRGESRALDDPPPAKRNKLRSVWDD